ncbi:MAG: hypothetical protein EBU84_07435 [Actinobacteria bacterium]|nr:hypothetical protein [Actinomycetota bacterium]
MPIRELIHVFGLLISLCCADLTFLPATTLYTATIAIRHTIATATAIPATTVDEDPAEALDDPKGLAGV